MAIAALTVDVHLPDATSLKDKRMVVRHLLDTARQRYHVAAAEVGQQNRHQRAELAFVAVASDVGRVEQILDTVERFVWSHPELSVLSASREWMDQDA